VFDLVILTLEILEDGGLLDNVIGELLPLHIAIAVDVYLLEEVGQISYQSGLTIGQLHLPKLKVSAGDVDELWQVKKIVLACKLFLEHVDSELVEIKRHICDHAFVVLLDAFVASPGRENGMDVQRVLTQTNRHSIFYSYYLNTNRLLKHSLSTGAKMKTRGPFLISEKKNKEETAVKAVLYEGITTTNLILICYFIFIVEGHLFTVYHHFII
jgi:hypothetical protein